MPQFHTMPDPASLPVFLLTPTELQPKPILTPDFTREELRQIVLELMG